MLGAFTSTLVAISRPYEIVSAQPRVNLTRRALRFRLCEVRPKILDSEVAGRYRRAGYAIVSQSRGRYSMTTPVETKGERFLSYSASRLRRDNAQRRKILCVRLK
jgi:hypothetical protein